VLEWAMEHDATVALRPAAGLAWWWQVRPAGEPGATAARGCRPRSRGSDAWCLGHAWLGQASLDSADPAGALRHFSAVCDDIGDRGTSASLVRCLSGRSVALLGMGRIAEAIDDARRSVAVAKEDDPVSEAPALAVLGFVACVAGDRVGAVQLARQADRISAALHGPVARVCCHILTTVLIAADDLAAAERVCAAGPSPAGARTGPGAGGRANARRAGTREP
jgi:hypothetical protein